ncbi:MAG: hypothetical protein K0R29_1968 [Pseudobdellovibrio sp.]|jgi:hypothetical protein|nr:hypothetical protein [Pseudobdellovibrio sp.]
MKILFFIAIAISSISITAAASQGACPLVMQKRILLSDKSPLPDNTLATESTPSKQPVGVGK